MSRITDVVRTAGPVPSFYGILSPAATVVEDTADLWLDGFQYEIGDAQSKVTNRVISGGPQAGEDVVAAANSVLPFFEYRPFAVEASFHASALALTPESVAAQAKEALDLVTQKAVEREFWSGAIAKQLTVSNSNRYLASTSAVDLTPVPGTGIRAHHGQALLEEALGNATLGSAGTLHAPRSVADALKLKDPADGKTLVTPLGNTVVAGSGYLATGPNGTAPAANLRWMYATGPVTVRIGADDYTPTARAQSVDTRQNTIEYKATRPAAVTWSTSNLYAVLVDLSLDYA